MAATRTGSRRAGLAIAGAALILAAPVVRASDQVYTVANYPIEARAADAVAAKARAVADGQKAALRSLLKRLVPVSAYGRLKAVASINAGNMLDGTTVRSERNSSTEYMAHLDFNFRPASVRAWLDKQGIPYVDEPAEEIRLVPVWLAPKDVSALPPALKGADKSWPDAWRGLDLANTVTPVKLETLKPGVATETLRELGAGNVALLRTFLTSQGGSGEPLVAAIAQPDLTARKLEVTLIGTDAIGGLAWQRAYKLDAVDAGYTIELAAVVSLGVLEGRWKATRHRDSGNSRVAARDATAGGARFGGLISPGGDGQQLQVAVEFRGMPEWQELARRLSDVPGVEELNVAGLSARAARVSLRFPGDYQALAEAVARQGLVLRRGAAGWTLAGQ